MDMMALRRAILTCAYKVPEVEYTATGNPLTFLTDLARPLKSVLATWQPHQSGSGDPSPENVRAISGMDGVNVWQTGKNLLNLDRTEASPNPTTVSNTTSPRVMDTEHYFVGIRSDNYYLKDNVPVATVSNGTITIQSSNNNEYGIGFPVAVVGGQKYTLSFTAENKTVSFGFYDERWHWLSQINNNVSTVPKTVTVPVGAAYMVVVFRSAVGTSYTYSDIQLEVGESATAYEAPQVGTTYEVEFPVMGKNLFDKNMTRVDGKYYDNEGNYRDSSSSGYFEEYIPVKPSTQYAVSGSIRSAVYCYDSSKTWIEKLGDSDAPRIFTTPSNCEYIRIQYTVASLDVDNVQLEQGSSATPYEPYTATVYGGSLDLTTGVLTAEWKRESIGNYEYQINTALSGVDRFSASYSDYGGENDENVLAMSEIFRPEYIGTVNANYDTWVVCAIAKKMYFYVPQGTYENATAFKNAMADHYLVYKLATPLTYQLTPQQITALLGNNTMWADADELSVTYLKKG